MAWTYSDYVTYNPGSTKLSRFRLHVQEVTDALSQEMSTAGNSQSSYAIERYLARLMDLEPKIVAECQAVTEARHAFTRGVPI